MPRKPTRPFGHIAFSKDGKVSKEMRQLSEIKEVQELEAVSTFADLFNSLEAERQIRDITQLEQNGQDFSVRIGSTTVEIQLTELVNRSYLFEMSQAEYDAGRFKETVQLEYGKQPLRVDPLLRDKALWALIAKKIAKSYSPPANADLWLLIFTTDTFYLTEYVAAGVPTVSPALQFARAQLAALGPGPFKEIWFTNLETMPVRVWPM